MAAPFGVKPLPVRLKVSPIGRVLDVPPSTRSTGAGDVVRKLRLAEYRPWVVGSVEVL